MLLFVSSGDVFTVRLGGFDNTIVFDTKFLRTFLFASDTHLDLLKGLLDKGLLVPVGAFSFSWGFHVWVSLKSHLCGIKLSHSGNNLFEHIHATGNVQRAWGAYLCAGEIYHEPEEHTQNTRRSGPGPTWKLRKSVPLLGGPGFVLKPWWLKHWLSEKEINVDGKLRIWAPTANDTIPRTSWVTTISVSFDTRQWSENQRADSHPSWINVLLQHIDPLRITSWRA